MDRIWGWLLNKFKDYVLRSWKTTALGLIGAVLTRYIHDPQTREAVLAGIVATLGLISKDADRSGTAEQPRSSELPPAAGTTETTAAPMTAEGFKRG